MAIRARVGVVLKIFLAFQVSVSVQLSCEQQSNAARRLASPSACFAAILPNPRLRPDAEPCGLLRMKRSEVAEEIFAQEYAIDRNGTRAAIAAGYAEKSAHVIASRMLRRTKVQKIINAHLSRLAVRANVSAERVLHELDLLAHSNMLDYVVVLPDGKLDVDFTKVTREQMAAVQEIKVDTTGGTGDGERKVVLRTTFKLADKGQNLERLGKHLKLFTDVVEHKGLESLVSALSEKE